MNELLHRLDSRLEPVRAELQRNPRLRWMLGGAGLVLLVYLLLVAGDYRGASDRQYSQIYQQLVRLEAVQAASEELDYSSRLAAEEDITRQLETRLWRADSKGLAAADYQTWLTELARQHELAGVRLELSELQAVEGVTQPLWRLDAELRAVASRAALVEFLAALAGSERQVVVDRLRYQPRRGWRVNLLAVAYFRLEPGPEVSP